LVEWIFAFETRRIVSRRRIDNVVDDIVKLLEYPKGFPQEHLMSAGQLLLNPHYTHPMKEDVNRKFSPLPSAEGGVACIQPQPASPPS
jgi:hypothetical protein